jgi:hypothetical protein
MARRSIPQYDPAKRGSFILETDSSFDLARFEAETATLVSAGREPSEHPMFRYWTGDGRFDLDAEMQHDGLPVRPRDYFNQGDEPEVFVLRRLTWQEFNDVERMSDDRSQSLKACRLGVAAIEGSPIKLRAVNGQLTDESMQALHDLDPGLPVRLGVAVRLYNRAPTDAEKKR